MDKNVDAYACLNSEYMHILRVSKSHKLASIKNSEQVYQKNPNPVMMWLPIFLPWNFTKGQFYGHFPIIPL